MSNVSAVVLMEQEVSWQDGRLQYELVSGAGPRNGWVTVNVKGKDLLVQMPPVQKDGNRNTSESLDSRISRISRSPCSRSPILAFVNHFLHENPI